jgi:hypothetical protein
MIFSTHGIIGSSVNVASGDADALAFFTAAGITDTTQKSAVNTLVTDLKAANIWTKMKALYPMVGGSATSHKFNLKDPRDLDAAYRLVFSGGGTHSATGYLPNGTTAYADTKLIPSSLNNYNSHLSTYSRSQILNSGIDIGCIQPPSNYFLQIYSAALTGSRSSLQRDDSNYAFFTNSLTTGHFLGQILSQSNCRIYKNAILSNTNTTSNSIILPNSLTVYIGAANINGTAAAYSNRESAFASIGDGLTEAEATAFYTAVQAYQTTLNRQV